MNVLKNSVMMVLVALATSCQPQTSPRSAHERLSDALKAHGGPEAFVMPTGRLSAIPQPPENRLTNEKVLLGLALFWDTALATPDHPEKSTGYSCATCHLPRFAGGAGQKQGMGEGGFGVAPRRADPRYQDDECDVQPVRTPSYFNLAFTNTTLTNGALGDGRAGGINAGTEDNWQGGPESNWLGWPGLETQAHAGLGIHNSLGLDNIIDDELYKSWFRVVFPGESKPFTRENAALAIAAYERTVMTHQSPWQRYLRGAERLSNEQAEGAIVFLSKGCTGCHSGPALSSDTFHNFDWPALSGDHVIGEGNNAGRGGFTKNDSELGQFKTAQLYNLRDMGFYGHGASFTSVEQAVLAHPNTQLTPRELKHLLIFLDEALYDDNMQRYVPNNVPSGRCFPNDDPVSRRESRCQ